nr:putative nucleotidyltransferase, ribonuclease H [Tanacetum cinerariifolium]
NGNLVAARAEGNAAGQNANQIREFHQTQGTGRFLNRVIQNAVQNSRVQNVGNQNGLIGVQGNGNQNQIGNGDLVAARAEGNAARQNRNQIRCYNCRGVGHYARNCTVRPRRRDAAYLQTQLLIAQKEEVGIQLQVEEYDLMAAAADLEEIEEVNANCILMADLQQASTSPIYDTDGSAEVHENYDDNEIFNMFTQEEKYTELLEPIPESHQVPQNDIDVISEDTSVEQGGETVEQHPANFKETRALYESLYYNLAIEVEKVNSVNCKLKETYAEMTTAAAEEEDEEDEVHAAPTPPSPIDEPSTPPHEPITTPPKTCTTLSHKVAALEQGKVAQALEIFKLKIRVKKLEKKRGSKSSGLKRIHPNRGRIEAIDDDKDITMVDIETEVDLDAELHGRIERKDDDNVAAKEVNDAEPTVFDDEKVTINIAQTLIKMKAEKARLLDEQIAKRLHDEEVEQAAAREKDEEPSKKRVAKETLLQESFKKLRAEVEVSGSESTQETLTHDPKEMSKEDVKNILEIVPVSEFKVEALQVKVGEITQAYQSFKDMLKYFDKEDLDVLWRLVKQNFSLAVPTVNKEKALWVELKRLFKPDADDVIWKLQRYMHYPIMWKLYSNCGVHQVSSTTRRHDMYMLTEKDYPLSSGVITLMLSTRLQVEEDNEMARDLVMKIFIKANQPKSKILIHPLRFFQISIAHEDQANTTFTCPYRTFDYRRIPFGLCNAPATFQRCMAVIFHDMVKDFMEVFMDDFPVFGNSFDCFLANLDRMLARCEETNLGLNWEKYHFMVKERIVLGQKISRTCIEVDIAKIDLIAKLPTQQT